MCKNSPISFRTALLPFQRRADVRIRQGATCGPPHTKQNRRTSSLLERLSLSKFPTRHPVLYEAFFELRSFYHRIQLLRSRGGSRRLEMGLVFEPASHGYLVRSRRTHARNRDTQKLLSDYPWLSLEDCHLFLLGWDAGEEWRERADNTASNDDTVLQAHSLTNPVDADSKTLQATQQGSKCDPLNPLP